jgi:hypothetical protein
MPAVSERILLALGVCLPVPLLAATGLSIPLPATVERLAASLVPFAEAASLSQVDESTRAPRGVIVRTPTEAEKTQMRERQVARKGGTAIKGSTHRGRPTVKIIPKAGQPPRKSPAPVPAKGAPTPQTETPKDNPSGGTETQQPQPSPEAQPVAQPQPEPQPQPQPQQQPPPPPPAPPPPSPPPPPPAVLPLPIPLPPPPPPVPLPIPLPPPPKLPIIGK